MRLIAAGEHDGPVSYALIELPHGRTTFGGDVVAELVRLSYEGLVRVLDLLVFQKAADGSVQGFELHELEGEGALPSEKDLDDVLSPLDVAHLTAAMGLGTVAGLIVWENLWAAPLAAAARHGGGRLLASGRLPLAEGESCAAG